MNNIENGVGTFYEGVSFFTMRNALHAIYFWNENMEREEIDLTRKLVIPMLHSFENPLQGKDAYDTFIQYWVSLDDRETMDAVDRRAGGASVIEVKVATVDLRFVGEKAEAWAKAFHHIEKRPSVTGVFAELCCGSSLPYIGPIIPVNIDYYGAGNSSIAFDLSFKIAYKESIGLGWLPLEAISQAPGDVAIEGQSE